MAKKISKVGLLFAIVNAVIVITVAYLDSLGSNRGFGLVWILWVEMPATFVIVPLADFIGNIYPVSRFILIPAVASIFGGLQWYFVGWLISKIKQRFFPHPKARE